jgi:hypothetical protein
MVAPRERVCAQLSCARVTAARFALGFFARRVSQLTLAYGPGRVTEAD